MRLVSGRCVLNKRLYEIERQLNENARAGKRLRFVHCTVCVRGRLLMKKRRTGPHLASRRGRGVDNNNRSSFGTTKIASKNSPHSSFRKRHNFFWTWSSFEGGRGVGEGAAGNKSKRWALVLICFVKRRPLTHAEGKSKGICEDELKERKQQQSWREYMWRWAERKKTKRLL